jgi:hypothetical protein
LAKAIPKAIAGTVTRRALNNDPGVLLPTPAPIAKARIAGTANKEERLTNSLIRSRKNSFGRLMGYINKRLGSNWLPPPMLKGRVTHSKYRKLKIMKKT